MYMRPVESKGTRAALAVRLIALAGCLTSPLRHRAFFQLAEIAGRVARDGDRCVVELAQDCHFLLDPRDPYWNRILHAGFEYEPEIAHILTWVRSVPYRLIDCGANGGYWSILASSHHYGEHAALALEPIAANFERLAQNRHLNGGRFTTSQCAVWRESHATLPIWYRNDRSPSAVGASLVSDHTRDARYRHEEVTTVSLDDLLGDGQDANPVLLKLDIEGAEATVLESSRRLPQSDCLIIFEDHGQDRQCKPSQWALEAGWPLFFVHADGRVDGVSSLTQALAYKRRQNVGYNFVATMPNSSFYGLLASKCA